MSTYDQPDFRKHPRPDAPLGPGAGAVQPGGVFVFSRPGKLDSEQSLRSYLLLRAITRSVSNTALWAGILILAAGVLTWFAGPKVLGILIGLVGVAVLVVRGAITSLGRRFRAGPVDPRVDRLVARTGKGLRSELRRVGLPGAPLLIAFRLFRPTRRGQTMRSLSRIDLAAVVPSSQVDELHLLLQSSRAA